MTTLILLGTGAYFLGSIPFGMIVARAQGVDIMSVGSGNIGATNVIRALGAKFGLLVFGLDVFKGAIPGILAHFLITQKAYSIDPQAWAFLFGCIAMLGHMFSPFLKFKGGKGIATGLGAALGSIPLTGLLAFALMILITAICRYVSLGSLIAVASTIPISIFIVKDSPQVLPFLSILAVFIFYKHRSNIQRLIQGTESKFTFKKSENLNFNSSEKTEETDFQS
jgi:acyl phosphate:glycerol-3-phosphate acyltransferase